MLKFIFPIDGDVVNANDGEVRDGKLYVKARLLSTDGTPKVNGVEAVFDQASYEYTVELALDGWRNTFVAETENGAAEKIVVIRLRDGVGYYQFFIDDNICFFRDLTRHQNDYKSIYENPYLGFFKSMHDKYGTLVHMHIYYETCEASPDRGHDEYTDNFNLSMMPLKYKPEFREAAEWLRFTFHARKDQPSWPHQHADYATTLRDFDLVTNEIVRFAGEELLSPSTVPHWNEMSREAARAFRTRGVRIMPGVGNSIQYSSRGITDRLKKNRDFWYDHDEDIFAASGDICLNRTPTAQITSVLDGQKANPASSGFIYMMIHEQYFYPDYVSHLPDFRTRVETGIRWAVENGYTCRWIEDVLLDDRLY